MIRALHHVAILSSDLNDSAKFYCDVLGMHVVCRKNSEFMQGAKRKIIFLTLDGCCIELIESGQGGSLKNEPLSETNVLANTSGIIHVGFEVDDLENTITELEAQGIHFLRKFYRHGSRNHHIGIAWLQDPDGTIIELMSRRDVY
jgi:catechol 2,3-dioxygenase-like lactoylglutathione lyase family enzyme